MTPTPTGHIPEVTVLLPAFNCARDVGEAISSILNQTHKDFELLVIDDGSTDNTVEIVESFKDSRLRLEKNPRNMGLVETLNRGLSMIHSPFIARMDADDVAKPRRLEMQLKEFKSRPNLVLLGSSADVIDQNGRRMRNDLTARRGSDFLRWKILAGTICYHPTVMIRRSLLNGLTYNKEHLHVEDYGLWMELMDRGEIDNLTTSLLKYRRHSSQIGAKYKDLQVANSAMILNQFLLKKYQVQFDPAALALWLTPRNIHSNPKDFTEFFKILSWMRPSNAKFSRFLKGTILLRAWMHYFRRLVLVSMCLFSNAVMGSHRKEIL